MSAREEALSLLTLLEGTVITDLRSLLEWAKTYTPVSGSSSPQLGGLNFTLPLLALVACEVFGFYLTGAMQHQKARHLSGSLIDYLCARYRRREADTGTYIMYFLQRYFTQDSLFKKLNKVLADFLRHDLVHGFGSANPNLPFVLGLFIDNNVRRQVQATEYNGKKMLCLNSMALAHQTIEAFYKLKRDVDCGTDSTLCDHIVRAKNYSRPLGKRISNQFEGVYNSLL
jgi:hypothetical protein